MKKFIQIDSQNRVSFINYFPFDAESGMGKTESELLEIGHLVDDMPEIVARQGETGEYRYRPETNTVDVEYFDLKPTTEEIEKIKMEQRISQLEAVIDAMLGGTTV